MGIFNTIVLVLSGLLLLFVGTLRLLDPIKNYSKNSGVTLTDDVNLLNEVRGVSSLMLFGGIIILSGVIFSSLKSVSFSVAVLIFIGFLFGRIVSMFLDGKPNKLLINGVVSEAILGGLNIFCLVQVLSQ